MADEAGDGPGSPAEAHAQLLADSSIQFSFQDITPPREIPDWLADLLSALAKPVFWIALVVGGLIILALIVNAIANTAWARRWRRKRKREAVEEEWRPDAVTARELLAEAERLAGQGDYEGAVRLVLQRSVEDISEKIPGFLVPSLTARDIAAAPRMPAPARGAFGAIAAIVESAVFARRPLGEDGWRDARSAYERFAFPDSWMGAPA